MIPASIKVARGFVRAIPQQKRRIGCCPRDQERGVVLVAHMPDPGSDERNKANLDDGFAREFRAPGREGECASNLRRTVAGIGQRYSLALLSPIIKAQNGRWGCRFSQHFRLPRAVQTSFDWQRIDQRLPGLPKENGSVPVNIVQKEDDRRRDGHG